jgi:hypothetical protein
MPGQSPLDHPFRRAVLIFFGPLITVAVLPHAIMWVGLLLQGVGSQTGTVTAMLGFELTLVAAYVFPPMVSVYDGIGIIAGMWLASGLAFGWGARHLPVKRAVIVALALIVLVTVLIHGFILPMFGIHLRMPLSLAATV